MYANVYIDSWFDENMEPVKKPPFGGFTIRDEKVGPYDDDVRDCLNLVLANEYYPVDSSRYRGGFIDVRVARPTNVDGVFSSQETSMAFELRARWSERDQRHYVRAFPLT